MPQSFMDDALSEARAADAAGEVPVGCVIVRDGAVIARAGNRTLLPLTPTISAANPAPPTSRATPTTPIRRIALSKL